MANQADWNTQILGMSSKELSFALNAQARSLACPSNLRRWGFNIVATCPRCSKPAATSMHILSGCTHGLFQHRYTWRHDNVLRSILSDLCGLISKANRNDSLRLSNFNHISTSFVKSGDNRKLNIKSQNSQPNLLSTANDWNMVIDFDASIPFPITDVPTTLRPDIVIYSLQKRIVIWGELTVPNEERIIESAIKKIGRYKDLAADLTVKDWKVHNMSIEVGSIGFIGNSVRTFLSKLGFPNSQIKCMLRRMSQAARRSSFYIWNARHSKIWSPPSLFKWSPSVAFPSSVSAPHLHPITSRPAATAPQPPERRRYVAIPPPSPLSSPPYEASSPVQTQQVTKHLPTIPEDSTSEPFRSPMPAPNPTPKNPPKLSHTKNWCDPWIHSTGIGSDIRNFQETPRPDQSSSVNDGTESSPPRVDKIAHFTKVANISSVESKDGNDQNLADVMAALVKSHTLRLASMARKASLRKKAIPFPEVEEKRPPSVVNPVSEEKNVDHGPLVHHNSPPEHDPRPDFEHDLQPEQPTRYEHSFTLPETFLRRSPWDL